MNHNELVDSLCGPDLSWTVIDISLFIKSDVFSDCV